MKWLKITVVLFLVTLVKSGPARSEIDADPDKMTLKEIKRSADKHLTFNFLEKTPDGTKQLRLVVKDEQSEINFISMDPDDPSLSYTFENDLTQFSETTVNSEILAINQEGDILGLAGPLDFLYPAFPGRPKPTATRLDDPINPGNGILLRVDGSLGTMNLNTAGTSIAKGNDIQYYQEKKTPVYTPCTEEVGVTVCDIILDPDDLAKTTTHDIILDSAILSYGSESEPQATVKLVTNLKPGDIAEAILLSLDQTDNEFCPLDGTPTTKCPVNWVYPSKDPLQVMIIKRTSDGGTPEKFTWTTSSIVIHDRNLIATKLGDDIIEGRWSMLADESIYRLVKTKIDDTDNPETITVDCSHLTIEKLCFGYFPHIDDGTYTLTVAYKTDESPLKFNETDQIESSPVSFPASSELAILSRHTTRHQNQLMTDVKICFQHLTPAEGRSFSHYEMLIINEKGQWLKHRILEEGEEKEAKEEGLCFTPFTINTKDFDLTEGTKVVVSQRGLDGVTVLASGGSLLF